MSEVQNDCVWLNTNLFRGNTHCQCHCIVIVASYIHIMREADKNVIGTFIASAFTPFVCFVLLLLLFFFLFVLFLDFLSESVNNLIHCFMIRRV